MTLPRQARRVVGAPRAVDAGARRARSRARRHRGRCRPSASRPGPRPRVGAPPHATVSTSRHGRQHGPPHRERFSRRAEARNVRGRDARSSACCGAGSPLRCPWVGPRGHRGGVRPSGPPGHPSGARAPVAGVRGPRASWRGSPSPAFALVGPPGAYDDVFFYAHMTQHILLSLVAAPLLVLGDPVLLVLRASSREPGDAWLVPGPAEPRRAPPDATRSSAGRSSWASWPSPTSRRSTTRFLDHPALHDYVEHPLYLVARARVSSSRSWRRRTGTRHVPHGVRMVSLFTVMVPMAMLGLRHLRRARTWSIPSTRTSPRPFGPGAAGRPAARRAS